MAAQQFIIDAYNKLIELLNAHTGFSSNVRTMTLIDWTVQKRVTRKLDLAGSKAPADYAEVELSLGGGDDSGYTLTPHFRMGNVAAAASSLVWTERIRQDYQLRITSDQGTITNPQLLHLEALTAFRKGNPRLGLTYVQSWGPMSWTFDQFWIDLDTTTNPKQRPTTFITIPVTFQFNGTDLLT